jgi:hypothetical protein
VKVSEVNPFSATLETPNALMRTGGATTVTEAFEVFPVPAFAEDIVTLLAFTPAVEPITFTLKVQEIFGASEAPEREALPEPATAVMVPPPQVPASPLGVAITSPVVSVSVNANPVSATEFAEGLVTVKPSDVAPFNGIVDAPKVFEMAGGVATFKLATALFPVPPLVEPTAPLVFVKLPVAVPCTLIAKVHEVFVAMVAPARDTALEPAAAVIVPPPQVPVSPFGVATIIPAGKVSENATPVSAAVLAVGLVTVKVRAVIPLSAIPGTAKALLIIGGPSTDKPAEAVSPVPPCVEVIAPVTFVFAPPVVPVTFTAKVQVALAARAAPESETVPDAAVAVKVPPPHEPVSPLGVATTKPAGKLSVKAIPLRADPLFGFARLNVRVVFPFSATIGTPKALPIVGGAITLTVAVLLTAPAPLSFEETAAVMLAFAPTVTPVTFTLNVHEPLTAIVPPESDTLPAPAIAVIVPEPQVPASPFGVATSKPAGKASLNATPVSAMALAPGFVIVKLNEVVALSGMFAAPNVFAMVGAETTPVPLTASVCGLLPPLSVIVSVARRAPAALGVNVTVIVQVAIFGTVAPQVPPFVKSGASAPVNAMLDIFSAPPLLLVSVIVCGGLATPTF